MGKGAGIDVSLETPEKIRSLQTKLYAKAKAEPRHKVSTRGTRAFGGDRVFGPRGVNSLGVFRRGRTTVSLA